MNLSSLRFLWFSGCARLVSLPEIMGKRENIQQIDLWQTAIEELPFSTENLDGLQSLNLLECTCLNKLPSSIFTLPKFYQIEAKGLNELLTDCLRGFANVVYLDLSYDNFTILSACIKECIHLKTILLENCKQLCDISEIPPNLEEIDARNCISLAPQSSSVLESGSPLYFFLMHFSHVFVSLCSYVMIFFSIKNLCNEFCAAK